jgi:sulfate adenylyltransferase
VTYDTGFCVWLTGLSGAGKSTIAGALSLLLTARGRSVTTLDGEAVRRSLSSGLGFSKSDRNENVRRIAVAASEVVQRGGVVIVAAISPYEASREEARALLGPTRFVLAFVDTPLSVCEARDVKGLYARARRGEITQFTGIDDPYEPPESPDVVLDTSRTTPQQCAAGIERALVSRGLLPA